MAKLSIWLPPFSPDYSGVSAVLFDLDTVTAMHDASGCTGNYTGYDDPRWYGSRSGIFCSGLRQMDAVLGDDEKLMEKMEAAAKDLKPDLLALVGSPVPMVIGADLKGIAYELEERTGIPGFGFDTTGTAYYDRGAFLAARELLDRFAQPGEMQQGRVNILGALPMDFGDGENISCLKTCLKQNGYETGLCLAMDYSLEDLKKAANAQVNLAVSRFGYLTALYMERRFHIPYLCGFPVGEKGQEDWLSAVKRVAQTGRTEMLWEADTSVADAASATGSSARVLIIGEQVMSDSIRYALNRDFGFTSVTVGCLYGMEQALASPGDMDLGDEGRIRAAVNSPDYEMIIADPFIQPLLEEGSDKQFLPIAQYALSSKLGVEYSACVAGVHFNQWMCARSLPGTRLWG